MNQSLRVTSIQSPNANFICQCIAQYLGSRLSLPIEFVADIPWPEREERLDAGDIHLGWICGWPYVKKADQQPASVKLVAAPVMQHPRYQQQPVYFSDVIVHQSSNYDRFADLRGVVWAYNEPHSHSGYNLTRYHLARLGEIRGYFGRVVEAGSHLKALDMVLARQIDATAVDSTVLELEFETHPELKAELRLIDTLGPSPIPPWVVTRNLAPQLREAIRRVFWQMHESAEGQKILRQGQLLKMVRVEDRDYDPIRDMARLARQVSW
jgi:phosphonate transport system substrate-binding protein